MGPLSTFKTYIKAYWETVAAFNYENVVIWYSYSLLK